MSEASNSSSLRKPGKTTAFFICLCVAAFLWFIKAINSNYTQILRIPVEFTHLPETKRPLRSLPRILELNVRTSGLKLFFIQLNQPFKKLVIDMNNLSGSERNYVLSSSSIPFHKVLKFETQIKKISPDTLYFTDNYGLQKDVPVKVHANIRFAPGFGSDYMSCEPSVITITGDSSQLKNIDTIYGQTIVESELSSYLQKEVALIPPGKNIFMNHSTVTVKIKTERLLEKEVVVPILTEQVPANVRTTQIYPARARLRFSYLKDEFTMQDTQLFKLRIDASTLLNGKARILVGTKPGNIHILSLKPSEAEVIMIKK